jgi:hypothetical protein
MKRFWQTMEGGSQCSHTASNIACYMPVPDGSWLRQSRPHTPRCQPYPASVLLEKNCPAGADNTNRAQTQGAGLSCVSSRISLQIRQYDSEPCPERQVENLLLLLRPVQKVGPFSKPQWICSAF